MMSAAGLEWNPVEQQLESLRTLMVEVRHEVAELRAENIELRSGRGGLQPAWRVLARESPEYCGEQRAIAR